MNSSRVLGVHLSGALRFAVAGVFFVLVVPCLAQEASAPEPAVADSERLPDLRSLLAKERDRSVGASGGKAVVTLRGRGDGTLEVRGRDGALLEAYPLNAFSPMGQVSEEAVARINAEREAQATDLAARKKAASEALDAEREAARVAAEQEAVQEKEAEARWQSDFTAKSDTYKGRRRDRDNVKAVKIDAREIGEDGTVQYEGKTLKPVRLWSTERKRYEMAIPVETP